MGDSTHYSLTEALHLATTTIDSLSQWADAKRPTCAVTARCVSTADDETAAKGWPEAAEAWRSRLKGYVQTPRRDEGWCWKGRGCWKFKGEVEAGVKRGLELLFGEEVCSWWSSGKFKVCEETGQASIDIPPTDRRLDYKCEVESGSRSRRGASQSIPGYQIWPFVVWMRSGRGGNSAVELARECGTRGSARGGGAVCFGAFQGMVAARS